MLNFLAVFFLILASAQAQTVTTFRSNTIISSAQVNSAFGNKVDTTGGTSTNQTLNNPIVNGGTFNNLPGNSAATPSVLGTIFGPSTGYFTVDGTGLPHITIGTTTGTLPDAGAIYGALATETSLRVSGNSQNTTAIGQEQTRAQAAEALLVLRSGYSPAVSPASGATVTASQGSLGVVLKPASVLAALTVSLPPSPTFSNNFCIISTQAITALTMIGGTVVDPPPYVLPNWAECFTFDGTNWQRTTDVNMPAPSVSASMINAANQMTADLQASNAVLASVTSQSAAIDTAIATVNVIGPASMYQAGIVLAAAPLLGCIGSDASGNPNQPCSQTAFEPYQIFYTVVAVSGGSDTIPSTTVAGENVLLTSGITVSTWTETLPASPIDQNIVEIDCAANVTSLTIVANTSQTIRSSGTSITTSCNPGFGGSKRLRWFLANSYWLPL